ncbi:hypothetical protein KVG29_05200 [Caldicoprobacter algeriensis]|uniref:hypothetical protein n=1 Tax=Caldicoprobacter algeriensis TaxID=699281 RepID=UPI00207A2969|nr:hypothetical protein [Caldicoprobacter algeriensis]MCM8900625.1 hypothetical protein [Caldicoprobacter algeriensis]
MPYNTKPIKVVYGKPIPQHFNPAIDDYEVLLGDNGASRHVLYDKDGNPLSVVSGKLEVRATEIEALLAGLPTSKTTSGNFKAAIVEPLPAGSNVIGKVGIDQTANGVQIVSALPAGDNNIGNVDIVSTPADATPGSAHPAKAILIAGSDGTNARRILTDANGVVQVQVVQTTQEVTMLASAARTASGDTSATPVDVKKYKEAVFFLDVTAVSGTAPTLDVKIKTKDPVSGKWFDLVNFTQVTAVTSEMKAVSGLLGSQIAVFYTIGGTTPSFTFSVGAVLKS